MNKPKNGNEQKTMKDVTVYVESNIDTFVEKSSRVQDKPATQRMIKKNLEYAANSSHLQKLGSTKEGLNSIMKALEDSFYHAATLPDMGAIVPFGKEAIYIPAVENYEFLLSSGKNPIMKDIFIVPVHENDIKKSWSDNDGFHYEIQHGMPKGEIIGVYVGGTFCETGKVVGNTYDEPFLMKIAEDYSKGYQDYLQKMFEFKTLKSEGKLSKDKYGREGIKKKGPYGEYFVLEKDIINPYVGPNKVKMLMKSAGKHFFKKYVKMANAMAMADEWKNEDTEDDKTMDQAADSVLEKAAEQFENVVDAEVVETEEKKEDDINNL